MQNTCEQLLEELWAYQFWYLLKDLKKIICAMYSYYKKFIVYRKTTPIPWLQLNVTISVACLICRLGRRPYGFCRNPCLKKDCPSNTICRRSSANRCRAVCKSKVYLNFTYYLCGVYADRNMKMDRSNFRTIFKSYFSEWKWISW